MAEDIQATTWVAKALGDTAGITAQANAIAQQFADFIAPARSTLDIAIYDFRLDPPQGATVIAALNAAAARGVVVRVAYFDQPTASAATERASGGDPTPGMDAANLAALAPAVQRKAIAGIAIADLPAGVQKEPIEGGGHLMHSKYMVRDGQTVWMGSANFTTAAWSVQDNNVVVVNSAPIAQCYTTDFDELWQNGRIAGTGKNDLGTDTVDGEQLDVAFSPGEGSTVEKAIAGLIMGAQQSVHIASMVISSGPILAALAGVIGRKVPLTGVYDGPEMAVVQKDWAKGAKSGTSAGKPQQWAVVQTKLAAKHSAPYSPNGPHNFMHNKLVSVDGKVVATGSFNFSENATHNAENVLTLHDPAVADQYAQYVDALVAAYAGTAAGGAKKMATPQQKKKPAKKAAGKKTSAKKTAAKSRTARKGAAKTHTARKRPRS
jgi:phosphatidylserine/phosphatidylglycerophosphate/cardiolipin synthase-like enzyme